MDNVRKLDIKGRNRKKKTSIKRKKIKMKNIDYSLLCAIVVLLFIGIVMVYSSSSYYALYQDKVFNSEFYFTKEIVWTVVGIIGMVVTMSIDYHIYKKWTPWLVIITIGLLVLVLFLGADINGARRWIRLGGLSLQPSELAKYVVVLYLALLIDKRRGKIKEFKGGTLYYLAIAAVFAGLIILEKNLSITAIIMMVAFIMILVGGAKLSHLFSLIPIGLSAGLGLILMESYRLQRLTSFLDPWADPSGDSYQLIQSLYALGSGGLFGVGLGNSRQKALFMPEPHNDFIFAIIGEELGLIGCIAIISIFIFIVIKGTSIAVKARDNYGYLLAIGIISVIAIQAIINIAVVTGSMPVTGVPMPLISYGGTSLVFNLCAIGILLNISRQSKEDI
ncbi:stage V sporulation protein E [Clostridium tertium]|uniref:stage V sporulation protein E n=1 Tax=Clostridium tertium TaxID=1559 RepID=UPI000C08A57C|nr:stage V sporulation protein E [Clostridium tertium]MDB1941081.1 stage V sporulation protein E [Clostridium tertium]MDB1948703.1 stage V sporulation protein E [Clostridium tertium]MDB1955828.1 stage V sporulation protein E [Clostridium tertium]MDB1959775.1 stage V sporulation protein E [Clostridium tertium]MDB1963609.1 stage V sporulation protein E [Clostridium tertium]